MLQNQATSDPIRKTGQATLTGHEQYLDPNATIVSKTDITGKISYVNKTFMDISGYNEQEILGAPHSVIRHSDMPRAVFKLLWDTLGSGKEIFAYVINRCKNGDHYWVMAHVTPSYTLDRKLIGYHSSRRAPRKEALAVIRPLYKTLCDIEQKGGRKEGLEQSTAALMKILEEKGLTYEEFILSI